MATQTKLEHLVNRDLFSNYYLENLLPESNTWKTVDGLEETYQEIKDLYDRRKVNFDTYNEAQLEDNFIKPLFEILGMTYEVQETVSRRRRVPDYGLFEDQEAADKAIQHKDEKDFYKNVITIAEAKRWGRNLDKRGDVRDFTNPSHQIFVYLQETPVDWGILTNGREWRLYYSKTSHKLDSYLEIDLPTILEKDNLDAFKYFYLFFRKEAFLKDKRDRCFLDRIYEKSNIFSQELGEDLKANIYEAIRLLAEGFLEFPENDLDAGDGLDLIHDSSLIYLYRLIFVLYAESEGRDLLDTGNRIYHDDYSLNSLKQNVCEELERSDPKYRDWQSSLWDRLEKLFLLIDKGSKNRGIPEEELYIPAYNGGLFRTEVDEETSKENKFLQENKVGDSYLAEVIDLLTRHESKNGEGRVFVDYSSLDIRHLGSIYEGLLEYHLNVAEEKMLAVKDGKEQVWYTESEFDGDGTVVEELEEGEVYLTTDKGERKATGSYYTPEYIVQYIVENTLDPILKEIKDELLFEARGNFANEFAERVFELKVLDPAMGSGHFLTNGVDHLAREIVDAHEKQAEEQGAESVDESHDIHWARRQVAQKCIYGVDLNSMAVELAKVSLWLRTLAAQQPLAFLDHHLKTGNSLIGSDIEEIEELDTGGKKKDANSATLDDFGMTKKGTMEDLMKIYQDIIKIENQDLEDIKEMEEKYHEFEHEPIKERLEAMANVHTAREFGVDVPDRAFARMAEAIDDAGKW
ncbi:MAG: DNA methyltransferase, partial [Candidatus Saliniplasma sp.]